MPYPPCQSKMRCGVYVRVFPAHAQQPSIVQINGQYQVGIANVNLHVCEPSTLPFLDHCFNCVLDGNISQGALEFADVIFHLMASHVANESTPEPLCDTGCIIQHAVTISLLELLHSCAIITASWYSQYHKYMYM